MTQHMIDTQIALSQCARCKAYVFACQASGVKVAADPRPLDVEGYRAALVARRAVWSVRTQAGRPWKLLHVSLTTRLPWAGGTNAIVAEHSCGTRGMNVIGVDVVPVDPHRARANGTEQRTGTQTPNGTAPDSPVSHAIRPRSDLTWKPALCCECRVFFEKDEAYVGYYYSATQWWACHADGCPRPPPSKGGITMTPRKPVYDRVDKFGRVIERKTK